MLSLILKWPKVTTSHIVCTAKIIFILNVLVAFENCDLWLTFSWPVTCYFFTCLFYHFFFFFSDKVNYIERCKMGVLPTPRKIKIPTGDSNSEASSAPQTGHYIFLSALQLIHISINYGKSNFSKFLFECSVGRLVMGLCLWRSVIKFLK